MTAEASSTADRQSVKQPPREHGDQGSPHVVIDEIEPSIQVDLRHYLDVGAGLLAANKFNLLAKRAVDILGSIVGLVLLSPFLLAIAIAVTSTSPGPAIFKQPRVGLGGRKFDFYKFRSMRDSAEEEQHQLTNLNEATGPIFKMKDDPRITRVGRFIRRSSIDELPQLWNVLRGEMSLVGPRPSLPDEVARYSDWERQRLLVRPGITCIWQVKGRSNLDFDTWVSMDIEYIESWRLWSDLVLLAKTIPAVLSGRGAY